MASRSVNKDLRSLQNVARLACVPVGVLQELERPDFIGGCFPKLKFQQLRIIVSAFEDAFAIRGCAVGIAS